MSRENPSKLVGNSGADTTAPFSVGPLDGPAAGVAVPAGRVLDQIEAHPCGAALIVVKRGPNAGSRFPLDRPVTSAGRHPRSDIFLDDFTASRRHVEFRRENDGFRIVDVGSLNGTYVNHQRVVSAELANGDEIQIGNFRLVFLIFPPAG